MVKPATGVVIASLCVVVKRGGKNPCVVEFASNTAEELAAEEAPAIIFPPAVRVPGVVKPATPKDAVLVVSPFTTVAVKPAALTVPLVFTSVTAVFPS